MYIHYTYIVKHGIPAVVADKAVNPTAGNEATAAAVPGGVYLHQA